MSLSLSSNACIFNPSANKPTISASSTSHRTGFRTLVTNCQAHDQQEAGAVKLNIGSPIIITEAPKMIKTAASVPCLRINSGLLNPGDVGRIVSRKPMDVWAVRLSIGTYLLEAKYFKPLQLDD